jgi:hypothetical protein
MQHDIASLRTLVNQLAEDQFRELCRDHFPYVSNQLTTGMTRSHMVRLLLDYAERQMELDKLVDAINPHNPKAHEQYVQQFAPEATPPPPAAIVRGRILPPLGGNHGLKSRQVAHRSLHRMRKAVAASFCHGPLISTSQTRPSWAGFAAWFRRRNRPAVVAAFNPE